MAKPNSLTTKIRDWLVDLLKVYPDEGEGWCVNCSNNNGRTLVLNESSLNRHVRGHRTGDYIQIRSSRQQRESRRP